MHAARHFSHFVQHCGAAENQGLRLEHHSSLLVGAVNPEPQWVHFQFASAIELDRFTGQLWPWASMPSVQRLPSTFGDDLVIHTVAKAKSQPTVLVHEPDVVDGRWRRSLLGVGSGATEFAPLLPPFGGHQIPRGSWTPRPLRVKLHTHALHNLTFLARACGPQLEVNLRHLPDAQQHRSHARRPWLERKFPARNVAMASLRTYR
mmetsp:Transcript_34213/g.94304  ORF Transcript_34213/g.94304 Transcript_34213/m.94304 type:complete len:205 (-) Transcript_34213:351-965(-)